MSFSRYPDYQFDWFRPRATDLPFISAFEFAQTNVSVRNSELDLRFLVRDRADSMVLAFCEYQNSDDEFIWRTLARFRFYETVNDPKLREFVYEYNSRISQAFEKYDSVESFRQNLDTQGQTSIAALEDLRLGVRLCMLYSNIWFASEPLLDPNWLELAKTPKRYNKEMDQRLRAIRGSLKYLHGVPGHRSQLHADRDRELWLRKGTDPSLSFGQLGREFGISDAAAEGAYKRQVRRESARLKGLQQTAAGLYKYYEGDKEQAFQLLGVRLGRLRVRSVDSVCDSERTNGQIENNKIDLRFLARDRADSLIVSLGTDRISESEYIWRSLSSFRFFEIVKNPELREFIYESRSRISQACEEHDSVLGFSQNQSIRMQRFLSALEDLRLRVRLGIVASNIWSAYSTLLDPEWLDLAKTPQRYNKEMDQRLRAIKGSLKYLHGVPSHRSRIHADRDRELWLTKRRNPGLRWGQLGLKFGIGGEAVRIAYESQVRREFARLKSLQQTAAGLYKFYEGDEKHAFRLLGGGIGWLRLRPLPEAKMTSAAKS